MTILIPMDSDNIEEAQITSVDNVKKWVFSYLADGKIKSTEFFDKKEDIKEFIEVIIVNSQTEYVWPFMEENIAVLVAPVQKYFDDIIEAFLFKELHDLNN